MSVVTHQYDSSRVKVTCDLVLSDLGSVPGVNVCKTVICIDRLRHIRCQVGRVTIVMDAQANERWRSIPAQTSQTFKPAAVMSGSLSQLAVVFQRGPPGQISPLIPQQTGAGG